MSTIRRIGEVATYKPLAKCGAEELAARQLSIKPSGGVLFARNTDGEEKAAARQLILDLFTLEKYPENLKFLTMPGVSWRFERKLLAVREPGWMKHTRPRRTFFTGVENDRAIYFAGVTQMPGVETPHAVVKSVIKGKLSLAEMGVKTKYAMSWFANIDDVLTESFPWDVAWLDYTGPLTSKRLRLIAKFYENCVSKVLIVTALKARWDSRTGAALLNAGGYWAWLRQHLRGEVLHELEYMDTSPMAQFAVRKEQFDIFEGEGIALGE